MNRIWPGHSTFLRLLTPLYTNLAAEEAFLGGNAQMTAVVMGPSLMR